MNTDNGTNNNFEKRWEKEFFQSELWKTSRTSTHAYAQYKVLVYLVLVLKIFFYKHHYNWKIQAITSWKNPNAAGTIIQSDNSAWKFKYKKQIP